MQKNIWGYCGTNSFYYIEINLDFRKIRKKLNFSLDSCSVFFLKLKLGEWNLLLIRNLSLRKRCCPLKDGLYPVG